MFLNNFQSFMTDNPSALWQSQLLQRKVRLISPDLLCDSPLVNPSLLTDDGEESGCELLGAQDGAVQGSKRRTGHQAAIALLNSLTFHYPLYQNTFILKRYHGFAHLMK